MEFVVRTCKVESFNKIRVRRDGKPSKKRKDKKGKKRKEKIKVFLFVF